MHILISNDDGIHAPGIRALHRAVHDLGDVTVAAPDSQMSAVGHAITLSDPIKAAPFEGDGGFRGWAIGGTPADCVKLAVEGLLDRSPDLVMSGINFGPNAGISVIYSGTVSAATEGTILGIPSIAVSLCTYTDPIWETGERVAREVARRAIANGLPPDTLLNVNVPNIPFDEIRGFRITKMGRSKFNEIFHRRTDPRGNVYYWMDGDMELAPGQSGTDVQALEDRCVSITPLWFDLTHHGVIDRFGSEWDL